MPHLPSLLSRHRRAIFAVLAALLAILLIECVAFNLPYWRTRGASTDSAAYENTVGAGLERTDEGLLRVTDPTAAWLEVKADGSSDYARIDLVSPQNDSSSTLNTVHIRASVNGESVASTSFSPQSPRSLFIYAHGEGTLRVSIEEPKGSIVPIHAVRANVRVPFTVNPLRLAAMVALLVAVACWQPNSKLWRIRLNPSSRRQRLAFAALLAPIALVTLMSCIQQLGDNTALVFHEQGGYTYDFDQYGHIADALLHGRTWLDLNVPQELASAANPYDPATRSSLLADGVSPIYWDYAYQNGHWYSYFGVLPAVLLYMPYQLLTGHMLPTATAVLILMAFALLFLALLVIRLIARFAPHTSLAATSIAVCVMLLGSNASYLLFRRNFYSVPFAASLALSALGLWLWLGAQTTRRPLLAAEIWHVSGAPELSLPRLGLGALCIAANFGCRPTFCLTALLGIALFWPQIRAAARGMFSGRTSWRKALLAPTVVLVCALVPVVPLMAYNVARFGSPLDFGNAYQITVTDMTCFHTPLADALPAIGYYLFLPLHFIARFPWVALSPAPMPEWVYAEPMVGGLITLCPLLLLAFALPFLKRNRPPLLLAALILAVAIVAFDALNAGLGWRYMADFGWLFSLAAIPVLLRLLSPLPCDSAPTAANSTLSLPRRLLRFALVLVLLWSMLITLLSLFTVGRHDNLIGTNPAVFHNVLSWFIS